MITATTCLVCLECNQVASLEEWQRGCPNPVCRTGLLFQTRVNLAHQAACKMIDAEVEARCRASRTSYVSVTALAKSSYPPAPMFEGDQLTLWHAWNPYGPGLIV